MAWSAEQMVILAGELLVLDAAQVSPQFPEDRDFPLLQSPGEPFDLALNEAHGLDAFVMEFLDGFVQSYSWASGGAQDPSQPPHWTCQCPVYALCGLVAELQGYRVGCIVVDVG